MVTHEGKFPPSAALICFFLIVTEKSPKDTSRLKESMDLYEEIVTEEQQSRESTHSEVSNCVLHFSFSLYGPVITGHL